MLTYFLFIVGFIVLIKGADLLINGASSIGKKLGVRDIVIGLTIVAFGTSLPEFFANVIASSGGNSDIALGNIIGSNIGNLLLILGISSVIFPLKVLHNTTWKEIPFSLLAVIILFILLNDKFLDSSSEVNILSQSDGLILLSFFMVYLYYIFSLSKEKFAVEEEASNLTVYSWTKAISYLVLGLIGLVIGAQWIIDGAIKIAGEIGISQSLIGLSVVALGTSLPELVTSAVAAYKKNADIAIANVIGSNIFNVFFILGISSIINPLPISNMQINIDIGITILSSFLLFIFMFSGKRHTLDRWEGIVFIIFYIVYMVYIVLRG